MHLINKRNYRNEIIPIIYECNDKDIGKPMTMDELHEFAVELIMVC
jgi:hypothetical protein